MSHDSKTLTDRADFFLCLARAFLAPRDAGAWEAMRDALPADLRELADSLGYLIGDLVTGYEEEISKTGGPEGLLQVYSALFLAPPAPVRINTGMYLDGTVGGGSVREMERAYTACGVERSEEFRDLSDHLGVQLEFVAYLYGREAAARETGQEAGLPMLGGHFLDAYVKRWLPGFIRDLETACRERELAANPWLPLAVILDQAVAKDAVPHPDAKPRTRAEVAIDKARNKRAERGVTDEELQRIEAILREKGLSTDHLHIPVGLRDESRGWKAKVPPAPRRKSE